MKYEIGQILYVLMNRETKICPVQVVEEIIKRSLTGEVTSYIVKVGKKNELSTLSEIDGEVFSSIDLLKETLHDKITKSVNTVIENAKTRADEWYVNDSQQVVDAEKEQSKQQDAYVTLPDGTHAKIKVPFLGV